MKLQPNQEATLRRGLTMFPHVPPVHRCMRTGWKEMWSHHESWGGWGGRSGQQVFIEAVGVGSFFKIG